MAPNHQWDSSLKQIFTVYNYVIVLINADCENDVYINKDYLFSAKPKIFYAVNNSENDSNEIL